MSQALVAALEIFSCGMWDLVPCPGIEPGPPASGAQSIRLLATTAREVTEPQILNANFPN